MVVSSKAMDSYPGSVQDFLGGHRKFPPELLDEFAVLRRESLTRLYSVDLQSPQLRLTGIHPAFGPVTVRQLLATWTAHDLAHILQISRVMAKRLKEDVGPWSPYLSVMK
jgi:hypothetical protein